jgi:hypothetical protein
VHTDTLISVGNGEFYDRGAAPAQGRGARLEANQLAADPTRVNHVNIGIATQAMLEGVQRQTLGPLRLVPTGIRCEPGARVAAVSANRASGSLEAPYRDALLNRCMWH